MGNPASAPSSDSVDLQRAQYVWEEYRYRHDLIWKLLFRMTAVAVLLAITPFTQDLEDPDVEDWVKLLPGIALLVVAASAVVLRSELARFAWINHIYEEVQKQAVPGWERAEPAKQAAGKWWSRWRPHDVFGKVVRLYPIALFVVVLVDGLVLWLGLNI